MISQSAVGKTIVAAKRVASGSSRGSCKGCCLTVTRCASAGNRVVREARVAAPPYLVVVVCGKTCVDKKLT